MRNHAKAIIVVTVVKSVYEFFTKTAFLDNYSLRLILPPNKITLFVYTSNFYTANFYTAMSTLQISLVIIPVEQNNCLFLFNLMLFFFKFSHCQVTSQEAPWIEKPSGSSVLPGLNKLIVTLFYVCFSCMCLYCSGE